MTSGVAELSTLPYVIVSTDGHVGPSLKNTLRAYCEAKYLQAFDDFVAQIEAVPEEKRTGAAFGAPLGFPRFEDFPSAVQAQYGRIQSLPGQEDPHARLRDLDADGVAAEVIFAGGQNGELLPFLGVALKAEAESGQALSMRDAELQAVGCRIYNRWLADFISTAPDRMVGLAQIPHWDIDAAVKEVEWARTAGLGGVNFPAPCQDFPAYNDPVWNPLWEMCERMDMPLCTHNGGGDKVHGSQGPGGYGIFLAEADWKSRKGLWQLIFGGVFERYPGLKLVFAEQRTAWVPETLKVLDSAYFSEIGHPTLRRAIPKKPSEYWTTNCFVAATFLAHFEALLRHEVGMGNLMWGSDYPHYEGTWPRTELALRKTFAGIPEAEVRPILGENAARVFKFDLAKLRVIADRIGPTPQAIGQPLEQKPADYVGNAFREIGPFA